MDNLLKQFLDKLSEPELVEVEGYILDLKKSLSEPKLSLSEVMDRMFSKYPGTKYFAFGSYGKGAFECAGEVYSIDSLEDYWNVVNDDECSEFKKELPGYEDKNNWLNHLMAGGDDDMYEEYNKEFEEIKKSEGCPVINDVLGFDLYKGDEIHVFYIKDKGIIKIKTRPW